MAPFCLKLNWQVLWYIHLAALMTSDSLEKASNLGSFKTIAASLPSLYFWQGHSLGVLLNSTISSSSCFGAGTPWSEEWHWLWCPSVVQASEMHLRCRLLASVLHLPQPTAGWWPTSWGGQLAAHCWSGAVVGTEVYPSSHVSMLLWLPKRPPWKFGELAFLPPLPGSPVLGHFLCVPVGGYRPWLCHAPRPA